MFVSKGWKGVVILWLAAQLVGCSAILDAFPNGGGNKRGGTSGTNGVAPPLPTPPLMVGRIAGVAKDGFLQLATVKVYAWNDSRGELLGSGTTDERGQYSLPLQTISQPVLLEITGGHCVEETTGKSIELAEPDALLAVRNYTSGGSLQTAITYYTTLATGLAENLVRLGMKPADAIEAANARLKDLLGIDTIAVTPTDILNPDGNAAADLQYGFATAALSSLTERLSRMNGTEPHSRFTSIKFIDAAYDDVRADGVLNGSGVNGEVAFGGVRLTAEIYRHELALHILHIANDAVANKTGLRPMDLFDLAQHLNDSTDPIFGGVSVIAIDRDKPNVAALTAVEFPNLTNDSVVFGSLSLSAMVMSFPGAASAELVLDDQVVGTAADPENPQLPLNTLRLTVGEGHHALKLRVTDLSHAVGESPPLSVIVSNRQTAIENVSVEGQFVGKNVLVTANVRDPAGVVKVEYSVSTAAGVFAPVATPTVPANATMFQVSAPFDPRRVMLPDGLPDGDAIFKIEVTNSLGFVLAKEVPFTIDVVAPSLSVATPIALDTSNPNDPQGRYFDRVQRTPCTPMQPADPNDPCLLYARRSFGLNAAVSDNHAIDSVTLTVDGQTTGQPVIPMGVVTSVTPTLTADPRNFVPPLGSSAEGQKTVMVIAVDKAQNSVMNSRQVVFDATAPTAQNLRITRGISSASGTPTVVTGPVEIAVDIRDPFGIAAASLTLRGGPQGPVDLGASVNQSTSVGLFAGFDSAEYPDGLYSLIATGTDRAGNQGTSVLQFRIDNSAPVTTGPQP